MKLAIAIYILGKIAIRDIRLRQMVADVDERAIYREMKRRWFVWSGKRWIKVHLVR